MAVKKRAVIPPLNFQTPIVDPDTGFPSSQFIQLFQQLSGNTQDLADGALPEDAGLDDLSDVSADSPNAGDVLSYDGTNWTPSAGGGMSHQQVMARASIGV